jgi:formylglycine-generating enzyme required for sulfatase activity
MAQRRDRRSGLSLGTSALLALVVSGAGGTMAAMAAGNAPSSRSPRTFEDCPFCPRMVVIPGGSFVMGSPPDDPMRHKNEGPQTTVTIATFAVAETEVTRGQFAAFAKETNRAQVKGCITDRAVQLRSPHRSLTPVIASNDRARAACPLRRVVVAR